MTETEAVAEVEREAETEAKPETEIEKVMRAEREYEGRGGEREGQIQGHKQQRRLR